MLLCKTTINGKHNIEEWILDKRWIFMLSLDAKCGLLEKCYTIHAATCAEQDLSCGKGCATCCTSHVTMTTLEGLVILRHLEKLNRLDWLEGLLAADNPSRFRPQVTINHLADLCARDELLPEESMDPAAGPCPLLIDDACPIYPVRPLGCRAMVSQSVCANAGEACMPGFMLTLNNVLMQYVEAIDVPGCSGNFVDVLRFLLDQEHRSIYEQQQARVGEALLANRPVSVLMVPPEDRQRLAPVLKTFQAHIKRAYLQSGLDEPS
jgi:Fe-S-cluster containining protein